MKKVDKDYYSDGKIMSEFYFKNGKGHRENGPAWICYYRSGIIKYEVYYINGRWHREDGPAYISYYENGQIEHESYYINDEECDLLQEMVIKGLNANNI